MNAIKNLIAAFATLTVTTLAAEPPSIAVVNFTGPRFEDLVHKMPILLESRIINGGLFSVVERSKLDSIIEEQGFQHSGQVSEDQQIRLGKLSGARFLLTGSVVDAGDDVTSTTAYGVQLKTTTKRCEINAKVLDTETGRAVFSTLVEGSYKVFESNHRRESGDGPWMVMAREVSDKIVRQLHDADFLKAYQPAVQTRVKVRFNTVPTGADVEVGGILVGNGGQELEVPAGLREITISLPGYQDWKKSAELRDGLTINASLKRIPDADLKIAVEKTSTAQVK